MIQVVRRQSYVSSKVPLTDTAAIAFEKTLCGRNIHKYAESYCRVKQLITFHIVLLLLTHTQNVNNK